MSPRVTADGEREEVTAVKNTFRGGVHPKEQKELSRDQKLCEFRPEAGTCLIIWPESRAGTTNSTQNTVLRKNI